MTIKNKRAEIYPQDAVALATDRHDVIDVDILNSIPDLLQVRAKRSPDKIAYTQYNDTQEKWINTSWKSISKQVEHWRRAIAAEGFMPGDRAAIRMNNCVNWVLFDQSVLAQSLVVVPVYVEDRADNIAYILEHTETRLLMLQSWQQWAEMSDELSSLAAIRRVVIVNDPEDSISDCNDDRVLNLQDWLAGAMPVLPQSAQINRDDMATIVYTSGTTGKPKGVMLSHANMMSNAGDGLKSIVIFPEDRFLSFLPLSHMFERTVGYYLNMIAGSQVIYNRSVPLILDDMAITKPTGLITVPRIFEKAYSKIKTQMDEGSAIKKFLFEKAVEVGWQCFEHQQGRVPWHAKQLFWPILNKLVASKVVNRFGGSLRLVISGGARLAPNIAKVFIGLGIDIFQGYGLTESSPVLTVNTFDKNKPSSIGLPFKQAQLRLGENNELQVKGPYVMLGYWKNEEATRSAFSQDGWLLTGDIASICDEGYISITGRIKEIIVLANGEKVPPADMEAAICDSPLFEQAMVLGEGKPYLTAIVVLNEDIWPKLARQLGVDPNDASALSGEIVKSEILQKIAEQLTGFPGYAFIRFVTISTTIWGVEDGSITPTLKLKRPVLMKRFSAEIEGMYTP